MKLIVGLGNPGKKYERTRHNAGFLAIDALAMRLDATWKDDGKHQALTTKAAIGDESVLLVKPQTFMNLSGESVQPIAAYYKVKLEDILLIQDELDLPPGRLAFLPKGSAAGHNGITSIQERLNTQDITRLRIGIGRPTPPQATEDWVLGKLEPATEEVIAKAPDAILDWITKDLSSTMNTWNRT